MSYPDVVDVMMALGRGADEDVYSSPGGSVPSRARGADRARQVRLVRGLLMDAVGPHERLVSYLQAALLWERPLHGVLVVLVLNCVFW